MRIAIKISIILLLFFSTTIFAATLDQRADVQSYINDLVTQHNFERTYLVKLFQQAHLLPNVLAAIKKPYEAKPWFHYREHFLTPERIQNGNIYLNEHEKTLNDLVKRYGVPKDVIVSILGVETGYGSNLGKISVFNALTTLSFAYPPRAKFFKSELTQFLLMSREQNLNPLTVMGSYAGAIGLPQFMPSSYRSYAVDYSGDGTVDLRNKLDAMASVANYLLRKGWHPNEPIAVRANVTGTQYQALLNKKLVAQYTIAELAKYGVKSTVPLKGTNKASLVKLDMGGGKSEIWLGLHNFYVITRYNPSPLYAMAVYRLSEAVNSTVRGKS